MIPAEIPFGAVLFASLWHAHLPPVESAEIRHIIQIIMLPKREQSISLDFILFLIPDCFQSLGQTDITDKPFLSFSYDRPDGFGDNMIFKKNPG